jgi:cytochrome b561
MKRMPAKNVASAAEWRYGTPAIILHWLLAVLIAFMAGLGWYMMTIEHTPGGETAIGLHKSIGQSLLLLVALRLVWRALNRPAPLPPGLPAWQARLSQAVEGGLYLCMVLVPITGLLGAGYQRAAVAFFGHALPRWTAPDRPRAELLFQIHSLLVWVTVVLVVLHATAGLKHLMIDRDRVFQRMWFRGHSGDRA